MEIVKEKDYTFIRVPKREKLSVIVERLQKDYFGVEIRYLEKYSAIGYSRIWDYSNFKILARVSNNKLVLGDRLSDYDTKCLAPYAVANTFIEVDV